MDKQLLLKLSTYMGFCNESVQNTVHMGIEYAGGNRKHSIAPLFVWALNVMCVN